MSAVNKRILDAILKSNYPDEIKQLIKSLLMIELRNIGDKNARYSEDYDRYIKNYCKFKESYNDENGENIY